MTTKQEISVEELEREIIEYLDSVTTRPGGEHMGPGCNLKHGRACALGTCVDNMPRVTPVDMFNDGMTVWIAGEPGGKIANIMRNPNVSVGVYEPVDHSTEQKSMQLWGTAELINLKNDPEEFKRRLKGFGLEEALKGMIEQFIQRGGLPEGQEGDLFEKFTRMFNFIKIIPKKIVLLHMGTAAFPVRKIWEPGRAVISSRAS